MIRKITILFIAALFAFISMTNIYCLVSKEEDVKEDKLNLSSKSAILIEANTGKIIYDKNANERLRPASVTKIMTLLLIYETIEEGIINWEDTVTVSKNASGMGGSQVYLEENETQTVKTLTKCIAIASANDAAVCMAEYIATTEEKFVEMMNKKAKELGMKNTNFENASGLDSDNHYTSANDIAIMSRELTIKFPEILKTTSIWTDEIIHKTKRGEEVFGLTNTNKLIKWYDKATGLKTGSTSLAKYCLSGTATNKEIDLIAVVMAAPDYKVRFQEVIKLFEYGFSVCKKYEDKIAVTKVHTVSIKSGIENKVNAIANNDFIYFSTDNEVDLSGVSKEINIYKNIVAPVRKGQKLGEIKYYIGKDEIGKVELVAEKNIKKIDFRYCIKTIVDIFLFSKK